VAEPLVEPVPAPLADPRPLRAPKPEPAPTTRGRRQPVRDPEAAQ
jgi:hypothetical protein